MDMESCDPCGILFPSKIWLDKHKMSPQHAHMQKLWDNDHNYAIPPQYSGTVASAKTASKTGSSPPVSVNKSGSMNHNHNSYRNETAGPSSSMNVKKNMMAMYANQKRLSLEPGSGASNTSRPQDSVRFFEEIKGSLQKNPNLSGARGGNSVQGKAFAVPPNHQRAVGGHLTDRPAAPGSPQVGRLQQNSIATTARIPAQEIRRLVSQRDECAAGTQRKTFPQGSGTVPQGNQGVRGTLKQAPPRAPGMSKKRQLELERQHERYKAQDYFLIPPKKSVPAAAGSGGKGGKAPARKNSLDSNKRFAPFHPSKIRGNGIHGFPKQPLAGGVVASTSSSSMRTSMKPAEFAGGRGKVTTKAVGVQSSEGIINGGKSALQKTSPNPDQISQKKVEDQSVSDGKPINLGRVVISKSSATEADAESVATTAASVSADSGEGDVVGVAIAAVSPFEACEGGVQASSQMVSTNPDCSLNSIESSSSTESTKLATEGVVSSTSSMTGTNINSEDSDREADFVAAASTFETRENYIKAAPQNLGSNPDHNLTLIQPSMKNVEEDQNSSYENFTELASDPVVTSTSSVMETNTNSTSFVVAGEIIMDDQIVESSPTINTIEDEAQVPTQQNSSNQLQKAAFQGIVPSDQLLTDAAASSSARCGERVVPKNAPARTKKRGKAPARKKKRSLANRFKRVKGASKKGKVVSTSPNVKSTKRSPGGISPWLSAAGRGGEEVIRAPTAAKRNPQPKLRKGIKRARKVTLKQLKQYVPTMPGKDYKMPLLTAIGSYTTEAGIQMWICLVCSKIEPMKSSKPMVCCEICNDWYHFGCVGIKKQMPKEDPWYCKRCIHRSSPKKT